MDLFNRRLTVAILAIAAYSAPAGAATTWWVTNQGLDSGSCGSRDKPCRSISAAVAKALDGDVVEVGAGLYGDLNGDGAFTGPGEERLQTTPDGRSCIVCISKAIKLLSLHGADVTIIDAGNNNRRDPSSSSGRVDDVVNISRSGVAVGGAGAGFTVAGSGDVGVHINFTAKNIKISDNVARGNAGNGFQVDVIDESFPMPFPVPISQYSLTNNTATDNGTGFSVAHDETDAIPERVVLTGNVASGNTNFGFALGGIGFQLQFTGNVASHNGIGLLVSGNNYEIRNSSFMANRGQGILINGHIGGSALSITGNSIIGNQGPGVEMLADSVGNSIRNNNIYGNLGVGSIANCGIVNEGFDEAEPTPTIATDNYWGAATGPGADPADNAGKPCDSNHGNTVVKPFATAGLAINP